MLAVPWEQKTVEAQLGLFVRGVVPAGGEIMTMSGATSGKVIAAPRAKRPLPTGNRLRATYHVSLPNSNTLPIPPALPSRRERAATMSTADLVYPPPNLPPASALRLSQSAPRILSTSTTSSLPWPLSLLTSRETQETWASHENLLLSCLRTGDDKSARQCLDRLKARFGEDNQRVVALRFLYEAAVAEDKDLRRILEDLERVLKEDPTSLVSSQLFRLGESPLGKPWYLFPTIHG